MSSRVARDLIVIIALISNAVVGVTAFICYQQYDYRILLRLSEFSATVLVIASIFIALSLHKKGWRIRNSLEQSLISIRAYYNQDKYGIYYLPAIRTDLSNNEIRISIDDLRIRRTVDNYRDGFSSALPDSLAVEDYYFNDSGSEFNIRFKDSDKDQQKIFCNLKDYLNHIDALPKYSFEIDPKHIVRLTDRPHWLVAGSTGSGKSYFTQLLILQFAQKGFDITVLDVKESYAAFSELINLYVTEPSTIVQSLLEIANEMRERQKALSDALRDDPRALAVDKGYRQKVVIIEEFIGLKTLLNKEEAKILDSTIKEISVLARSVNISLFVIAQSAEVDLIDSSIKNNLNKVYLGYLAPNIAVSTFGAGVDVPEYGTIEKGCGYVQPDRVEQVRIPFVRYTANQLKRKETNGDERKA